MPATHEDPAAPVIPSPKPLPASITPRQVTLRDRVTVATLVPFSSADQVPQGLLSYLSDQLNKEIEKGDTYPMIDPIPLHEFGPYWFSNFGAVMLLGDIKSVEDVQAMEKNGVDWSKICLGSFHIKPNYPGRSSHVCNGTFLVTDASRNKGVGRLMGEGYLEWAPKLGYTYSVFNLVYENNVASCRIWDALGFKRIGKVPGCGNLRSYPGQLVDAIIYGRDLGPEGEDSVTQERFDKIRYYLKHSKYPRGADRAEKSRLRSAATHYKLVGGQNGEPEKLMLKDKEVVSDPQQQYEIARRVHCQQHGGINKTTATIAVKYHWVRIKETVSRVIRDCPQCRESSKAPVLNGSKAEESSKSKENSSSSSNNNSSSSNSNSNNNNSSSNSSNTNNTTSTSTSTSTTTTATTTTTNSNTNNNNNNGLDMSASNGVVPSNDHLMTDAPPPHQSPFTQTHAPGVQAPEDCMTDYANMPLDPQIIDINPHLPRFQHHQTMADPYEHQSHGLSHVQFDEELRGHAPNDYQVMVNDESDSDALRRDTLGLVNHQLSEPQHDQEMLARYVDRSDDELDFN